jgi:hypothetical protein
MEHLSAWLSGDDPRDRRRHRRYAARAPIVVEVGDRCFECHFANVSDGGALLMPALDVPLGTIVKLTHKDLPATAEAEVVGVDDRGTRLRFDSEVAGAVITTWLIIMTAGEPDAPPP